MRVKICGITDPADAAAAAEAGADAIGLNFVGGPRRLLPATARDIMRNLPESLTPVALVRLTGGRVPADLRGLLVELRITYLQVYDEAAGLEGRGTTAAEMDARAVSPAALGELIAAGFRPMPVLAVRDAGFGEQLRRWGSESAERRPSAVVLDAYDPQRAGGTGRSFRWEWVAQARAGGAGPWPPVILAGGLTAHNVAEAIRAARPDGVDVASGVEIDDSPGRKDREKLIAFVRNARQAMESF
ncbi:MAG: hypothetical protein AMXMBFR83_16360 [Phycisphaerae bacterium]